MSLTAISLVLFAGFLTLTAIWVLEIMARAVGLMRAKRTGEQPVNEISDKCDYTTFCEVFGGMPGKISCQVVMALYVYGAMWAYVATFASTLQMFFTLYIYDTDSPVIYYACVGIYFCIVLPLTMLDLAEQAILQAFLTVYRFFAFAVMVCTVVAGFIYGGGYPISGSASVASDEASIWGFKWSGFGIMFTSTAFALTVHYNMPNSLSPVRNKKNLRLIALAAILTAVFFYFAVGGSCALYFTDQTNPLVVLNWRDYTGDKGGWGGSTKWWGIVIQLLILFFPILNLSNDFPLVAITLATNLDQFVPKKWLTTPRRRLTARLAIRFACVVPPVIAGTLLGELDKIFTFSGMFAFFLVFIIPCVYQWLSKRTMVKLYGKGADRTPYSGFYSHDAFVLVALVVGLAAFALAFVDAVLPSSVLL
eukprot:TRINITY_DN2779_c0_g1_i1.p1 TRINITY_DN2779_c0_g1~~TRINITY_DN2779_c0_g1_i1.p1  ORF type:complete len:421 (-),score=84.47 TRINITY_DN2779_c0_g1_i1:50-1312(-)